MARKRSWLVAVGVALVGVLSVGAGPAGATIPAGNLLANPGAEDGAASPTGSSTGSIPGWIVSSHAPAVVRYGTVGGFPTSTSPAVAGNQFFSGGDNSPDSGTFVNATGIGQTIDVSGAASEINAGTVEAEMTACLGGYAGQEDFASLEMVAEVASGGTTDLQNVGGGSAYGPTAAQRGNQTELLPVSLVGNVPINTATLDADVGFERRSGLHTYNDGYADNVQLTLFPAGSAAPAPLPCPKPPASFGNGSTKTGSGTGKVQSTTGSDPAAGIARVGKNLTFKGRYALVKLRCTLHDSNCKGTLGLAATGLPKAKATAAKKAKATKLGSAKFTIAKSKTKTVKVKLKRSIRKRLGNLSRKRLKKLKITATAKIGRQTTKFTLGAVRKH
jgi:hypothetical protein